MLLIAGFFPRLLCLSLIFFPGEHGLESRLDQMIIRGFADECGHYQMMLQNLAGWPPERSQQRCNSARCKFSTEKPVISQHLYPLIFIRRLKIWNIQSEAQNHKMFNLRSWQQGEQRQIKESTCSYWYCNTMLLEQGVLILADLK